MPDSRGQNLGRQSYIHTQATKLNLTVLHILKRPLKTFRIGLNLK